MTQLQSAFLAHPMGQVEPHAIAAPGNMSPSFWAEDRCAGPSPHVFDGRRRPRAWFRATAGSPGRPSSSQDVDVGLGGVDAGGPHCAPGIAAALSGLAAIIGTAHVPPEPPKSTLQTIVSIFHVYSGRQPAGGQGSSRTPVHRPGESHAARASPLDAKEAGEVCTDRRQGSPAGHAPVQGCAGSRFGAGVDRQRRAPYSGFRSCKGGISPRGAARFRT